MAVSLSLVVRDMDYCVFITMCVHLAGLPAQRGEGLSSPEKDATPCVLERLCEQHDGLVMEAKSIKQHYFRPYMHRLFSRQVPTKPPQSSLHTSLLQTLYVPALQQTGPHKTHLHARTPKHPTAYHSLVTLLHTQLQCCHSLSDDMVLRPTIT